MTINGDTPGPLIEGDEGDTLRIHVENKMLGEATMHWHGVYQMDKYWNDGVPGVTQWPIEPRGKYTYEFTLKGQYGIYFYHGHFGPAFADGQRGPLWIRPAAWRERPYSLISKVEEDIEAMHQAEKNPRHLMVSDWNHEGMDILVIRYRDTGATPACAASLVTNGKGRTTCLTQKVLDAHDEHGPRDSMGCLKPTIGAQFLNKRECKDTYSDYEVIQANKGEKYLFINFINPGAHHELRIAIDEHDMYVVAADGEFVHPKKVQAINVSMGDRISVMVPLSQPSREYTIRMSSLSNEQLIQGHAILRYPGVGEHRIDGVMALPTTKAQISIAGEMLAGGVMLNEMEDLAPFPRRSPPSRADHTLRFMSNRTGPATWILASEPHQGFRQQLPPALWNEKSRGKTTFTGLKNGSTVDIIYENATPAMHPFHKHNHKAWIIGSGTGFFNWPDVATAIQEAPENFNMVDPPLRDGARLAAGTGSWTAIRYTITFPAMSMLHCHRIAHFAVSPRWKVTFNTYYKLTSSQAGQQVVLLEGQEAMLPLPASLKNMTHSNFKAPLRYGPLD